MASSNTPQTCGWDDEPAVARIEWDGGSALVCEAHRRSIASDPQGTVIVALG
jgi:hypothetical protein